MKNSISSSIRILLLVLITVSFNTPAAAKPPPSTTKSSNDNQKENARKKCQDAASEAARSMDGLQDQYDYIFALYNKKIEKFKRGDGRKIRKMFEEVERRTKDLEKFCKTNTPEQCKARRDSVYAEQARDAERISSQLVRKTVQRTETLLNQLIALASEGDALKEKLREDKLQLDDLRYLFKRDFSDPFFENLWTIRDLLRKYKELIEIIEKHVTDVQKILIGNICFKLNNVKKGEVTGKKLNQFEKAISVVMEGVLGDMGIYVDVLYAQTVENQFVPGHRRRFLKSSTSLKNVGIQLLRVMLGFRCNCDDNDPISDIWSKRRRQLVSTFEDKSNDNYQNDAEGSLLEMSRMLSASNAKDDMEKLLQGYAATIFGHRVGVEGINCGAIEYNST